MTLWGGPGYRASTTSFFFVLDGLKTFRTEIDGNLGTPMEV